LRSMLAKLALACASTSIWKATARLSSPMPASLAWKALCRSARIRTYRSGRSPRLAQNEQLRCAGREARGRMGKQETAVIAKNRIMIYGPKSDGTYIAEFKTADGEALWRSACLLEKPAC